MIVFMGSQVCSLSLSLSLSFPLSLPPPILYLSAQEPMSQEGPGLAWISAPWLGQGRAGHLIHSASNGFGQFPQRN